jgi:hypothetical protein
VEHLARFLTVRRGEARQQQLAELDVDLAALGDLERRLDRSGVGGERLPHLTGALEEELVGVEGELRLLEGRLRLNAEQSRVVGVVVAALVVDVGRGDQRAPQLSGVADDPVVRLRLLGDPVLLDLEVDVLWAEDLDEVVEVRARVRRPLLDQPPAEAGLEAPRERDHPLGVPGEELHVDVRLAALEALEVAGRGQLDEVAKALVGGRQQREVVALRAALGTPVVHEVRLEPEDRLHAVLRARLVGLDGAVHHAVVGEPEGGHAELGGARRHRIDLARPVE